MGDAVTGGAGSFVSAASSASQEVYAPGWRVIAASVAGTGHHRRGVSCQDAHSWAVTPDGVLVGAVADGAGSAPHASAGSVAAARAAVAAARGRLLDAGPADAGGWRALLADALADARARLEEAAVSLDVPPHELATTLILVIASATDVAAAQVGDGATVVRDREGALHAITTPRHGEYINETEFISGDGALETAQVAVWRGHATHIAALSDGLQMLALRMPDGAPHAPFFEPIFRFAAEAPSAARAAEQLEEFLSGPRVTARTDDDVTLLLAVRRADSGADRGHAAIRD